jgi:hypothetical protein
MRVIRNTGYARQQKSRAKWLTIGGFLLFAAGFVLVGFTDNVVYSYATLIPAYVLFIAGMQQLGKWTNSARRPRGDLLIDETLKHLPDNKYTMIHFTKVGGNVLEHVLLHPGGALLIVVRDVAGKIELRKKRFRRTANPIGRIIGASGPPLAQPEHELEGGEAALEALLKENQMEADVSGVVVFTAIDHQLDEFDPELDAISMADLADYVRVLEPDPSFRQQEREQIANVLTAGEGFERNEPARTRRPVVVKRRAT